MNLKGCFRYLRELFCAPSPVPVESMEAEVEDVKSTVLPAKSVESDDEDVKAAAPSTSQAQLEDGKVV